MTAATVPVARDMPEEVKDAIRADRRIVEVVIYHDGWIPNSYRWPSPGACTVWTIVDGRWTRSETTYDRKRSHGAGPDWVGRSAAGGHLAPR